MSTQTMNSVIADYFKTQPVLKAWLFGSFARGEETPRSGETVPEGQYVSGFTITKEHGGTIEATPNEDNMDYTFVMPADNVTVTAQTAPQEEYTLDLTEDEQVELTETQYMLLYTMLGYANYDNTLEGWLIDLNLDGKPDLQMLPPVGEDEETDRDDDFVDEWSVKRLAGADEVTKNYHFAFEYPFPYRYNGMLVKLSDEYSEAVQPKLEDLLDGFDNESKLGEWATGGQTHNVLLDGRTLYKDGDWNTLCLPFDVDLTADGCPLAGADARELIPGTSKLEGTTLTLNFTAEGAITKLVAGTPYIIKWAKADGYVDDDAHNIVNPVFYGVTITSTAPTDYEFTGGKFCGNYSPATFEAGNKNILYLGAANKLYWPNADMTLGAFRAYFLLTDDNEVSAVNLNFDGETTSLREKVIVNSEKSAAVAEWYTLDGRRLSGKPTQKGVYINGGRKVVIK